MNAHEFSKAVSKHITRALKTDITSKIVEEYKTPLDHIASHDAEWFALVFLIYCIRPPISVAEMHLLADGSRSARLMARHIISLADKMLASREGGPVAADSRLNAVGEFFETYLLGLFVLVPDREKSAPSHRRERLSPFATQAERTLAGWGRHMLDPEAVLLVAERLRGLPQERRSGYVHNVLKATADREVGPIDFKVIVQSEMDGAGLTN